MQMWHKLSIIKSYQNLFSEIKQSKIFEHSFRLYITALLDSLDKNIRVKVKLKLKCQNTIQFLLKKITKMNSYH